MYAQNLNKNTFFIDVMLILSPLLAYESYHKNFHKLITEKVLTLHQKKSHFYLDFEHTFCFLTSELKKKVVNFHVRKGPPLRFFTILGKNDQTLIKKISSKT